MTLSPKTAARPASLNIRYVGALAGRYRLSAPAEATAVAGGETAAVYACRTLSLSPDTLVVAAPVVGKVGDVVAFLFEHVGFLKARITRPVGDGFEAVIIENETQQQVLAARIAWLKHHRLNKAIDNRLAVRRYLRHPKACLYLGDGSAHACFVIDMSTTGAGLSAQMKPPVGTPLSLGVLGGVVVRHMEHGFAMRFARPVALDTLEDAIAATPSAPASAVPQWDDESRQGPASDPPGVPIPGTTTDG